MRYYNEERLHSALNYLCPADYYRGNPETLLADWKRKLKAAALRQKEVNSLIDLTKTNNGAYYFGTFNLSETTEVLHYFGY